MSPDEELPGPDPKDPARAGNPGLLFLRPEDGPAWRGRLLFGLVVASFFLTCLKPVQDPDTFWHLAVGRDFWQTGHLLTSETFSFTAPGAPWVNEEWLFQVIAYPLWRAGGDHLLQFLTALCGALAVALAWRTAVRAGASPASATIYLLLLSSVYSERLRFRPEMVSLVLMALLADRLAAWSVAPDGWKGRVPFLAILFFLWVQFHGAWAYGMLYLALFLGGSAFDGARQGKPMRDLAAGVSAALVIPAAALFVNPFLWRLPTFPLRHLLSFFDHRYVAISEWQRTPFRGGYLVFVAVAVATLLAILFGRTRFRWREFLPASGQVILGLYWVRYVAYAVVALAGVAAPRLRRIETKPAIREVLGYGALAGCAGLIFLHLASPPIWPRMEDRYPVQEAAFLRENDLRGNLYHEFRVGGFLEWALGSGWKVFLDGRFGPFNQVGLDYYEGHRTPATFRALLERYPADIAVFPYSAYTFPSDPPAPPRGPSAVLFPEDAWALVFLGDYGMVLLKREARWQDFIARHEYDALRPDDLPYLVWSAGRDPAAREALQRDLNRSLGEGCPAVLRPKFQTALKLLATLPLGEKPGS